MSRVHRSFLICTPTIAGHDGISTVARQGIEAVADWPETRIRVLSLVESESQSPPLQLPGAEWTFCGLNRRRFVRRMLVETVRATQSSTALVYHVNLLPAVLPWVARRLRLVVIFHGVEVWRPMTRTQAFVLRRATRIIAVSAYTRDRFRQENPQLADLPIDVCHHGRPPSIATPADHSMPRPFALIVGRMSPERYKGHDLLIELWPELLKHVPTAHLAVAGDGDDRPRLEAKVAQLGLADRVRFLGEVSDNVLAGLYRDCEFFAMPSTGEGFGLVFIEAMFTGKPCIAAPGAAAEIIRHEVDGLIVDPANRAAMLEALTTMFCDSQRRARWGESSQRRALGEFTDVHYKQRFLALLESTRAQQSPRRGP